MKRKLTFFGICVLICTLMISLGSCQKDYSEDIQKLQDEVNANKTAIAALNTAIAAGKLIKTVAAVTGGYQITFSDNTTITINHGATGATGATGPAGQTGATGATGFTPIIGIDAQGYWTVVTTAGGTATRILVGGNPVFAKFTTDQFGANTQGFITINGAATTVYIPQIAYVSSANKLLIAVKNADGTISSFYVPVVAENAELFFQNDLVSVLSPIGETRTIISFSQVPADNAAGWAIIAASGLEADADAAIAWANVGYGGKLKSGGNLPIILNPANVSTTGYVFEVIKQDGSLFGLQPATIEAGFNGAFSNFAIGTSNGLHTLKFDPTMAEITPLNGTTTTQLAVRAIKNGREVISGYQYAIKVQPEVTTAFSAKTTLNAVTGTPSGDTTTTAGRVTAYYPIGATINILNFYERYNLGTAPAVPRRGLLNSDFFKSVIEKDPASINSDIQGYITIDGTSVSTGAPTLTTITNINDKKLNFNLRTFDWVGAYRVRPVDILFYGQLKTATPPTLAAITQELTAAASPADQKTTTLTPMFDALQLEGKTELWRNQATDVKVTFTNSAGVANALTGVKVEFLDATNTVIVPDTWEVASVGPPVVFNTDRPIIQSLAKVKEIRHIRLTFNEAVVNPGNYIGVLSYTDRRPYATHASDLMTVKFNVTITAPTTTIDAIIEKMKMHKANLFDANNKLIVYGTAPAGSLVQLAAADLYDLSNAYVHLNTPAEVPYLWAFDKTAPAAPVVDPMSTVIRKERFNVLPTTMYIDYSVKLTYSHFNNANLKRDVETITVVAQSAIREGSITILTPLPAVGPATLQVLNGDLVTTRKVSDYVRANDYLGNNLNAFIGVMDTRIAIGVAPARPLVAVKNNALDGTTTYSHLVNVTRDPATNEWYITATNNVSTITVDTEVPLTLEITDLYGKMLKKEFKVLVKKNS